MKSPNPEHLVRDITTEEILLGMQRQKNRDDAMEKMLRGEIRPYRALSIIWENTISWRPYPVDWSKIFTPIEECTWHSIRSYGIPFCPQYPVSGYILDFADPVKKISLECDGKRFHDQNKDAIRDECLHKLGWVVIRLDGKECVRNFDPPWELEERVRYGDISKEAAAFRSRKWLMETGDGVIASIASFFYGRTEVSEEDALDSILAHSSTPIGNHC